MDRLYREGVGLAYQEAGSGAPPIVLVHDLGSDHTCFSSQFEHFCQHRRTVSVDLRGHGESDKPEGRYTIGLLADDLAWLCYELGLHMPVLLGHGLGAVVALDLASRYRALPAVVVVVVPTFPFPITMDVTRLLSLTPQAAFALAKNVSAWGDLGGAARRPVPVFHISLDRQWEQRGMGSLPEEISRLVDGYLSRLAGRAPP